MSHLVNAKEVINGGAVAVAADLLISRLTPPHQLYDAARDLSTVSHARIRMYEHLRSYGMIANEPGEWHGCPEAASVVQMAMDAPAFVAADVDRLKDLAEMEMKYMKAMIAGESENE